MTLSNLSSQHSKESDVSVDTGCHCFETTYNVTNPEAYKLAKYETESSDFNEDDEDDDDESDVVEELPKLPENYKPYQSRHSVSAEVYGLWNKKTNIELPVYTKSVEQQNRINSTLKKSFLFNHLATEDLEKILLAFTERKLRQGEVLIKQGDDGDCLYVIERGTVEVLKQFSGETESKRMCLMSEGETVGELALMYNCPRAATVIAASDVVLWKLDRETFNCIAKDAAMRRRNMYESFLKEVNILKHMEPYERNKIADALQSSTYAANEIIIREGDIGDTFYIIECGEAVVLKNGDKVMEYTRGDYFGELALLKNQPRAATVKAANTPVRCVVLDRRSFQRLLGPIEMFLHRNTSRYEAVN